MKAIYEFRKLRFSELDSGYAVHIEAYEWLKSRGADSGFSLSQMENTVLGTNRGLITVFSQTTN